ncbi:MAG: hypothetical protein FJ276_08585 [Planctomycetes bacterium]|nr:hypothetical protein [Planctomycetota bacterium]
MKAATFLHFLHPSAAFVLVDHPALPLGRLGEQHAWEKDDGIPRQLVARGIGPAAFVAAEGVDWVDAQEGHQDAADALSVTRWVISPARDPVSAHQRAMS